MNPKPKNRIGWRAERKRLVEAAEEMAGVCRLLAAIEATKTGEPCSYCGTVGCLPHCPARLANVALAAWEAVR